MKAQTEDIWLYSVCGMCPDACGIRVHRINGTVVKIEGDPKNPQSNGKLCAKGNAAIMSLYDPYRVLRPLKRTNPEKGIGVDPKWQEISWEEAIDITSDKLKGVKEKEPRGLMTISFDLSFYTFPILPAFLSAFGTPHWFSGAPAFFCGNVNHQVTYLTQAAVEMDPDFELCDYCIMFGAQTGFMSNRDTAIQVQRMADARMRGMKLVVVDPMGTNGAAKADEWLPIRPGTDGLLALAMLNVLINQLGIYDRQFLREYTNSPYLIKPDGHYLRDKDSNKPLIWDKRDSKAKPFDAVDVVDNALEGSFIIDGIEAKPAFQLLRDNVKQYTVERAAEITTIPAATIYRITREFGEAARIGSKITIEGTEFPYRPAAADFGKGSLAHRNGMTTGIAIQLLNIVIGAIDVPGGTIGAGGPLGPSNESYYGKRAHPVQDADGMLIVSQAKLPMVPYPLRQVRKPQTLQALEIFPIAAYSTTVLPLNANDPEKFQVPYRPGALINFRSNMVMGAATRDTIAEFLKRIPFIVSFARVIDETAEFADIIFPELHDLERLDPFPSRPLPGSKPWQFTVRQQVAQAPSGIGHWMNIIQELAERIGISADMNILMNTYFQLSPEYALEPNKKYTLEEIGQRQTKSILGEKYNLEWFKENGCFTVPKTVEESYIRPFIQGRIPLYVEHFVEAGEAVKQVTDSMGLSWDISDYRPLPDWKPCPSYTEGPDEYNLYAINYKFPFHTFTHTAENPWLDDLSERHPYAYWIVMSTLAAGGKGIKTGDAIWVETNTGRKVRGRAKVSECIHPEVIAIGGNLGHWAEGLPIARGKGVHFNTLLPLNLKRMDMVSAALDACVRVKVYK